MLSDTEAVIPFLEVFIIYNIDIDSYWYIDIILNNNKNVVCCVILNYIYILLELESEAYYERVTS